MTTGPTPGSPTPGSTTPGSTTPGSTASGSIAARSMPSVVWLDPLTLPLQGSRLIEASAGTGKTWTIAVLYLRLVLGHRGSGAAPARPLLPGEILVMTFTRAATKELSDRIRSRLVEAAECFRGERDPEPGDTFLRTLIEQYPDGTLRREAAWRLSMAAESMDDSAVYTIDAWCQRMLNEHAFDSGCLFDEALQADEAAMLAEAARDYWRQQVYPLTGSELEAVIECWKDVDTMRRSIRGLLDKPVPASAGEESLGECIRRTRDDRTMTLATMKEVWPERIARMQAWIDEMSQRKDRPLDQKKLARGTATRWIAALRAWVDDPDAPSPDLTATAQARLVPAGIRAAIKAGFDVDVPPCFAEFEELLQALARMPGIEPALRAHAAVRVKARLQQLKDQAGVYGFADMLDRLNVALDVAVQGDQAERLRQRIVAQYPVALIDEFQDTSPVQASIFDRLYRIDADDPATALLLIGDPKQSIYGFRGADIHTYLRARRATVGRHDMLGINHRSSHRLVAAVNGLFQFAEDRGGEGAFRFSGAAGQQGLPFVSVDARGREESLVTAAGPMPPIAMCVDEPLQSKDTSRSIFSRWCAERIVALLNDSTAGFRSDASFVPLRPADIAVLVQNGFEADAVRNALQRAGVPSVYLSDKDNVFATAEAVDLLRLMQAVAAPRNVRLARAALATALIGFSLDELRALASDDESFDAQCAVLTRLHQSWQSQGVLSMIRRALHAFDLPARWLAGDGGERLLTNVLHLAELLQSASATLDGEQALVRWLAQQIDDAAEASGGAGAAADEQVLRLESDADLVKIVTVYKAKGLEYPLVFVPFAAHFRQVDKRNATAVFLPDDLGNRHLSLTPDDDDIAAADAERQREDLRLLYVALTRARHHVWVGLAPLRSGASRQCVWHKSAIGYLLSGELPVAAGDVVGEVRKFAARTPEIQVDARDSAADPAGRASPAPVARLASKAAALPLAVMPEYEARFDRLWSVSSYSALMKVTAVDVDAASSGVPSRIIREDEPIDAAVPGRESRVAVTTHPPVPTPVGEPTFVIAATASAGRDRSVDPQPWHRFPRGAFAGNFLHDQLEWLADEGFGLDASPALQQMLVRRCERQGWGNRASEVVTWLRRICVTQMPALGVSLAGLDRRIAEMEFWLPSDGLSADAVDELCRQHVLPGRSRPALPDRELRGLLMGFADLVYEHDGRFGVLDYKSNALGAGDADYTQEALEASMLEHRYDVQAALYLLAIHRLLGARLRARYVPERHLHGAVYLFLRGVTSDTHGCYHLPAPIPLIEALDRLLVEGASAAAADDAGALV